MLSPEDIEAKVEALEAQAAMLGEPDGASYRALAVKWRLIGVEAVFMDAIQRALASR
jgi:hypothetical protein